MYRSISGFSILIYQSFIFPVFAQLNLLKLSNKLYDIWSCKSSTFVLKTRLGFSIGIFIGIALALQINLKKTDIFTVLDIPVPLHDIFLQSLIGDFCCCCLFFSIPDHYLPFLNKRSSISPLPIFILFSPLFYRLGPTVQCRIEVVITGILVSFLISRGNFHYYCVYRYDVCCSFFVATLHQIKEVCLCSQLAEVLFCPPPPPPT